MTTSIKATIWSLIALALLAGCNNNSREHFYRSLEKKEIASGVRYDSLFKGLYFGMPYNMFRDYCMKMHVKGVFREGGLKSGAWLECKLKTEMKYPASLNFFPEFHNNAISQMHAAVYYDNEVSWKAHSITKDSLMRDVLLLMEKWYGPGFTKIDSPDSSKDDIYVTVNGNRRITLYQDDSKYMINLWFVDLQAKKDDEDDGVGKN